MHRDGYRVHISMLWKSRTRSCKESSALARLARVAFHIDDASSQK